MKTKVIVALVTVVTSFVSEVVWGQFSPNNKIQNPASDGFSLISQSSHLMTVMESLPILNV